MPDLRDSGSGPGTGSVDGRVASPVVPPSWAFPLLPGCEKRVTEVSRICRALGGRTLPCPVRWSPGLLCRCRAASRSLGRLWLPQPLCALPARVAGRPGKTVRILCGCCLKFQLCRCNWKHDPEGGPRRPPLSALRGCGRGKQRWDLAPGATRSVLPRSGAAGRVWGRSLTPRKAAGGAGTRLHLFLRPHPAASPAAGTPRTRLSLDSGRLVRAPRSGNNVHPCVCSACRALERTLAGLPSDLGRGRLGSLPARAPWRTARGGAWVAAKRGLRSPGLGSRRARRRAPRAARSRERRACKALGRACCAAGEPVGGAGRAAGRTGRNPSAGAPSLGKQARRTHGTAV